MKIKILLITLFLFPMVIWAQDHSNHDHSADDHASSEEMYTCPMHPEVRQNKPGSCPICHMPLVKMGSIVEDPETASKISGRASVALKDGEEKLLGLGFHTISSSQLESQVLSSGRALSRNKVFLQVPESDVASVKKGARVIIESPSLGTEKEFGIISQVDNQLEPTTRTLRVIVDILTTNEPHLLSESTVMARIEVSKGEGLWVPESALVRSADRSYVFVLDEKKLVPTEVTLGSRVGEGFELIDGISQGAKILRKGTFLIDSESRLRGR